MLSFPVWLRLQGIRVDMYYGKTTYTLLDIKKCSERNVQSDLCKLEFTTQSMDKNIYELLVTKAYNLPEKLKSTKTLCMLQQKYKTYLHR